MIENLGWKEKRGKEEIKVNIEGKKEEIKEEKKEDKKDKKEDKKPEKKNGGKEVQHIDNIEEDIMNDFDDLDDLSANKNSGNYNSSQTVSVSQGYDNTVDSHQLENYNYIEENDKK